VHVTRENDQLAMRQPSSDSATWMDRVIGSSISRYGHAPMMSLLPPCRC